MIPARNSVCLENITPPALAVARRGYTVLPTSIPSTMARVSALMPLDCSQESLPNSMAAAAKAPVRAIPGPRLSARCQPLGRPSTTAGVPGFVSERRLMDTPIDGFIADASMTGIRIFEKWIIYLYSIDLIG